MSITTIQTVKSISFSKNKQPVKMTRRVMSRILKKQNDNIQEMLMSWKSKNSKNYEHYKDVKIEYLICSKCYEVIQDGDIVIKKRSIVEANRGITMAQLTAPIYQHESCFIKGVY